MVKNMKKLWKSPGFQPIALWDETGIHMLSSFVDSVFVLQEYGVERPPFLAAVHQEMVGVA